MSGNIIAAIAINGESVTKQPLIKSMRGIKKETLKLISDWISKSSDPDLVRNSNFFGLIFILRSLWAALLESNFFKMVPLGGRTQAENSRNQPQ